MRINHPILDREIELKDDSLIVSKTDMKGVITYVNRDFVEISGYSEQELLGKPHNIVRHPDMPVEAFADLWQTLAEGRPWSGYVKNRAKSGDYYWVLANVAPLLEEGRVVGYLSVRRKATRESIAMHEEVYRLFRERKQGKLRIRYGQGVKGRERFWSKLNLAGRMGAILSGLGLVVLAVMAYALLSLSQTNESVGALYEHRLEPVRLIGRIGKLMADNRSQALLALQHDPASPFAKWHDHPVSVHVETINSNISEISTLWDEYQKSVRSPEHKVLADAYLGARKVYVQEGLLPARELLLKGEFSEANLVILKKLNPSYNAASAKADDIFKYHDQHARFDINSSATRYSQTFLVMLGAFAALLIVGLLAGIRLIGGIRRPLQVAIDTFESIARGNYGNTIDISRNDELGKLNHALLSMQTRMGFEVSETKRRADEMSRIKFALDNVSMPVTVSDDHGLLIYMNRAAQELWARMASEIAKYTPEFSVPAMWGKKIGEFLLDASSRSLFMADLTSPRTMDTILAARSLRLTLVPVYDAHGSYLGRATQWQDRTSEVQIEEEIAGIVELASNGILTSHLSLKDKEGFYLSLAQGLNQLLETTSAALADTSEILGRLAQGDLTRKIEADFSGVFGQLKEDTNATIERMREIVGQIQEATNTIHTAASEIAMGNQDLSSRTEEQASSLQETAASMEQINATVRQAASNAVRAKELAHSSNEAALRGGDMVKQVVDTMTSIQESSARIADITGMIDSIAFQTNILALNAAVEAARAGEQGRGFAVVATEVRNLAHRSAMAAKEIKGLIYDSGAQVETGGHLVREAGSVMGGVVSDFGALAALITEIAEGSREQSQGVEQVTQAVGQMDEVTQQNAALVEQAAAAAESLQQQAESLVHTIAVFRLSEDSGLHKPTMPLVDHHRTAAATSYPVTSSMQPSNHLPSRAKKGGIKQRSLPPVQSGQVGNETNWEEF